MIQTQLRVGAVDDPLEREADRVADALIAGAASPPLGSAPAAPQRKCAACAANEKQMIRRKCEECEAEEKDTVRRAAEAGPATPSHGGAETAAAAVSNGGAPLSSDLRSYFEPRFGRDLSDVRVHAGGGAALAARAIDARAYTLGRNIAFASGEYSPATREGRHLIAHELAHVVQQGGGVAPQIRRQTPGDATGSPSPPTGPAPPAGGTPAPAPQEKVSFDILGADTPVADFLAKAAGISRAPDLQVTSLADLINQLEAKAPAGTQRCIDHISVFNHGMPGYQVIAGETDNPVSIGGAAPQKLSRSGFSLNWLFDQANEASIKRLRGVFCCDATMDWLGCGVAGLFASGGTRTQSELAERQRRFGDKDADRYADEADVLAHGADLKTATFGSKIVQVWADATCTSIKAATNFTTWQGSNDPNKLYQVYNGEMLSMAPMAAGQCTCDPASGRVHGGWAQPVDYGDPKWQADLKAFQAEMKPATGTPDPMKIQQAVTVLIDDIRPTLTVPDGIKIGTSQYPLIDGKSADPGWRAYTYEHLVFAYPNDPWKWIAINQTAIGRTPAFTRTVLDHELQHASDMNQAAFIYQLTKGPPPAAPADANKPEYRPAKGTPYGDYILGFHDEYLTGQPETSHVDIFTASVTPNFAKMTASEKADWAGDMFGSVPPDFSRDEELSSEALIRPIFTNMLPNEADLRKDIGTNLTKQTLAFLDRKDFARAQTLLDHFTPVWEFQPGAFARMWGNMTEDKKAQMQMGHK